MSRPLVPDELWEIIRPGKRGPPPVDDRACLTGIIFVLQSNIPWWMLPQEMGCGCRALGLRPSSAAHNAVGLAG
ncbi:MAG: transposase, partial [Isosphaeraceae bacterium]